MRGECERGAGNELWVWLLGVWQGWPVFGSTYDDELVWHRHVVHLEVVYEVAQQACCYGSEDEGDGGHNVREWEGVRRRRIARC